MQVCAIEQELVTLREDSSGSIEVRRELGEITIAEEVRRDGAIPQQSACVCARGRKDALEQLTPGLPVRRATSPAAPAPVFDEWKTPEITRD